MLLDHLFKPTGAIQLVIIRKQGKLSHIARPLTHPVDNDTSDKPFFPINKERE